MRFSRTSTPGTNPSGYYRNRLPERHRKHYDALLRAYRRSQETTVFPIPISQPNLARVMFSVKADHPELFWAAPTYDYWFVTPPFTDTQLVHTVRNKYVYDEDGIIDAKAEMYPTVMQVAKAANEIAGERERAEFLFDWLCTSVSYQEAYDALDNSQNAVGAFVDGKTACAGFSHAYKMLCDRCGIFCIFVWGHHFLKGEEESHAWNIIGIDGKFYHVDAASSILDAPGGARASRLAFGMSDAAVAEIGYICDEPALLPACDDDSLEAWEGKSQVMPFYDYDTCLWRCAADLQNGKEATYVKFEHPGDDRRFFDDVVEHGMLDDIEHIAQRPVKVIASTTGAFNTTVVKWQAS